MLVVQKKAKKLPWSALEFHRNELQQRLQRTQNDLHLIQELENEFRKFIKVTSESQFDFQNPVQQRQFFSYLKRLGLLFAELSTRQHDMRDVTPSIPWAHLTAMAMHFQRIMDILEDTPEIANPYLPESAHLTMIIQELTQFATQMIPVLGTELANLNFNLNAATQEINKLLHAMSLYKQYHQQLERLFIELNYINYRVSPQEFAAKHQSTLQQILDFINQYKKEIDHISLPPYLQAFILTARELSDLDSFQNNLAELLANYNEKRRITLLKLIPTIKAIFDQLPNNDISGILNRALDFQHPNFPTIQFNKNVVANGVQLEKFSEFMQRLLDAEACKIVTTALESIALAIDVPATDSPIFRKALLRVLIIMGESFKDFSDEVGACFPAEFKKAIRNLRIKIIHGFDSAAGHSVIKKLIDKDAEGICLAIANELVKCISIFKSHANLAPSYDLQMFNVLIDKFPELGNRFETAIEPFSLIVEAIELIDFDTKHPCRLLAADFAIICCGELTRAGRLDCSVLITRIAPDQKDLMSELIHRRGQLAHEIAARGFGGSQQLLSFCAAIKAQEMDLRVLVSILEMQWMLWQTQSINFEFISSYLKLIDDIRENTENLGSSRYKRSSPILLAAVATEAVKLAAASPIPVTSESFKIVLSNLSVANTPNYDPDLSPSKVIAPYKERFNELKRSPQKLLVTEFEKHYQELLTEYQQIAANIENRLQAIEQSNNPNVIALVDEMRQRLIVLEFHLGNHSTIRDFAEVIDSRLCSESSKLRTPNGRTNFQAVAGRTLFSDPNRTPEDIKSVRRVLFADDDLPVTVSRPT